MTWTLHDPVGPKNALGHVFDESWKSDELVPTTVSVLTFTFPAVLFVNVNVWVGPPPSAMRALGDKAHAKTLAAKHHVPVLAGYHGADQSAQVLRTAATNAESAKTVSRGRMVIAPLITR